MTKKIIVLYDLKNKKNNERTKILKKLYGYTDNSNYNYKYDRKGLLNDFEFNKQNKTILELKNKKDISKIINLFKDLNIKIDIAKI